MEQRPLRLGDILDDYCPRERRVTNHAIVAMIEDTVKQTRCTTCDAEHPYKGGQAPRRRKKETPSALYKEVLAAKPDDAPMIVPSNGSAHEPPDVVATSEEPFAAEPVIAAPAVDDLSDTLPDDQAPVSDVEEGPVHRPLIRAQLPRVEGQKDVRTPPDFTIRQSGGRAGNVAGKDHFRGGGGSQNRMKTRGSGGFGGNGHRPHGGSRFGGGRNGQGQGQGQGHGRGQGGGGFRSAQQPRHGGGKKRSR